MIHQILGRNQFGKAWLAEAGGTFAGEGLRHPFIGSIILGICYFLAGLLGLEVQTVQPGVTPIWPPSGIAFAALMLFGLRLWPGIFIGMYLLSWMAEVPVGMATLAAFGSVIEAALPVLLLRHFDFHRDFPRIIDTLLFIAFAVYLGPLFSATAGVIGIWLFVGAINTDYFSLWLFWWLGNSIGIMIIGAFLLTLWERRSDVQLFTLDLFLLSAVAVAIAWWSAFIVNLSASFFGLCLLIPVAVIAGVRRGPAGAMLVNVLALLSFLLNGALIQPELFQSITVDTVFINISCLSIAAAGSLAIASAFQEHKQHQELVYRACHDPLTDLFNRREVELNLESAVRKAQVESLSHCLLFFDLDKTKLVNDHAGHLAGDQLLVNVARILKSSVRSADTAGRIGGDEFAILLWDCPVERARDVAGSIREKLGAKPFRWQQQQFNLTTSVGLAVINHEATDALSAWNAADMACYTAKRAGGDRLCEAS